MKPINTIPIPLYHGTDKKVLDYSENERVEIQNICLMISDYTYHLLAEDGMSMSSLSSYKAKHISEIGDCWPRVINAFQKHGSRKNSSKLYQYSSLYLTGDKHKAEGYARNAFIMGEQGDNAYWLYLAASRIWNLKEYNPDMGDLVADFEKLIAKPHLPVILTFNRVLKEDLLGERGETIDWEMWGDAITRLSYRLKGNSSIGLLDGQIEYLACDQSLDASLALFEEGCYNL